MAKQAKPWTARGSQSGYVALPTQCLTSSISSTVETCGRLLTSLSRWRIEGMMLLLTLTKRYAHYSKASATKADSTRVTWVTLTYKTTTSNSTTPVWLTSCLIALDLTNCRLQRSFLTQDPARHQHAVPILLHESLPVAQ